jgi:hypothetical protein
MARSLRTISVWRGRCLRRSPTSSASARSARVRTRTRRASSWSGCCGSMGYPAAGGLADRRVLRRRHACAATRSDAGPRHLKLSHRELSGGTTRCRAADQGVHLRQKCWHGDLAGSRRVAGDPALTGPELEARLAGPSPPARRGSHTRDLLARRARWTCIHGPSARVRRRRACLGEPAPSCWRSTPRGGDYRIFLRSSFARVFGRLAPRRGGDYPPGEP